MGYYSRIYGIYGIEAEPGVEDVGSVYSLFPMSWMMCVTVKEEIFAGLKSCISKIFDHLCEVNLCDSEPAITDCEERTLCGFICATGRHRTILLLTKKVLLSRWSSAINGIMVMT